LDFLNDSYYWWIKKYVLTEKQAARFEKRVADRNHRLMIKR
jgi:hypothetical protein